MDFIKAFEAARRVSVPILIVRTSDQMATIEALQPTLKDYPVIKWDCAVGATQANDKGKGEVQRLRLTGDNSIGFVEAMVALQGTVQGTVVFALNAHRQLASSEPMSTAAAVQIVSNTREAYKANFRMIVLLAPYGFVPPTELAQDVWVLEHALPGTEELSAIVKDLHVAAKQPAPAADFLAKSVEAVAGLSNFAAEQQAAMSFTEKGLDLDALWERKRVTIEQTRGLSVYRGTERFKDIIGLDSVKARLNSRINGKTPIGVAIWLDEIDKVMANVEHDTSGVRMDQMRTLLTEMDQNEWRGIVLVGVSGGGKSLAAKAFANEAGVPNISLDMGGMEAPHVGESEMLLRQAVSVIKAVGRGHAYFIATSNNASVMRPEMMRRFTDGMFMVDVFTDAERMAAWAYFMKKYELKKQPLPNDAGWTGAEIRNCCRDAWDSGMTLVDAARFIVPISFSRADAIEDLRKYAHGRFLDATKPGSYTYEPEVMKKQIRAIQIPPEAIAETIFGDLKKN